MLIMYNNPLLNSGSQANNVQKNVDYFNMTSTFLSRRKDSVNFLKYNHSEAIFFLPNKEKCTYFFGFAFISCKSKLRFASVPDRFI